MKHQNKPESRVFANYHRRINYNGRQMRPKELFIFLHSSNGSLKDLFNKTKYIFKVHFPTLLVNGV